MLPPARERCSVCAAATRALTAAEDSPARHQPEHWPAIHRNGGPDSPEYAVRGWQAAGLLKPSAIKPILTTLEQRLVRQRLGTLDEADRAALRQALALILG